MTLVSDNTLSRAIRPNPVLGNALICQEATTMTKKTTLSDVMTTVMMTTNKALPSAVMTLMTTNKFANEF